MFPEYLNQYDELTLSLDEFQAQLRGKVINPDRISWSASQAQSLGDTEYQKLLALMSTSEELLVQRIEKLKNSSTQTLSLIHI